MVPEVRRERLPIVAFVALAITAIVMSRIVLRSERELTSLAAGALPLLAGTIAVYGVFAIRRGYFRALSPCDLALASLLACVCIVTFALPRAQFASYALLPYLALGGIYAIARSFVSVATVRWMLALTGALVAASVLLDAFGVIVVSPTRRPSGLLGNRNFAGEYLALALPAALVVFARSRRSLAILVVFGIALALTRCRTAWIAAALGIVAVLALSEAAHRGRRALAAALVVAGVLFATVLPTRLAWTEANPFASTLARTVDLVDGSGKLRVRQYRTTLHVLDTRDAWWTGFGPGAWQAEVRAEDRTLARNRIPHSDYLRTLSDGGIPALGALALTLLAAGIAAWRRRRAAPELAGFLGVLAVIALADAPLFRPEGIVVTAAVLAALARVPLAPASSCRLEPAPR